MPLQHGSAAGCVEGTAKALSTQTGAAHQQPACPAPVPERCGCDMSIGKGGTVCISPIQTRDN